MILDGRLYVGIWKCSQALKSKVGNGTHGMYRMYSAGSVKKTKYQPQIVLFASEVPVICGVNPYRCISDVFYTTWKRSAREEVETLELELASDIPETIEMQAEKIVQSEPKLQQILQSPKENTAQIKIARQGIVDEIEAISTLSIEEKENVTKELTSSLHRSFGIAQEENALHVYETQTKVKVQERNAKFWSKKLGRSGSRNVLLGGRVDGVAGEKVIEVKNRMRAFMSPLPKYDVYQMQTYLFLLDSAEGEIVEHIKASKESKSKKTSVNWDPDMWASNMLPYLSRFSHSLTRFINSETEVQERFLLGDATERKEIIRTFWLESPSSLDK